jgi:hypothetical protein
LSPFDSGVVVLKTAILKGKSKKAAAGVLQAALFGFVRTKCKLNENISEKKVSSSTNFQKNEI